MKSRIAPVIGAVLVAWPLVYFHFVGRQEPLLVGYCGAAGPVDGWNYGWPAIYSRRVIWEEWLGRPRSVGPLEDFNARSLTWNMAVCAVMVAGAVHVARRILSGLRKPQFSLRTLLLLVATAAGVCTFIRFDRAPDLNFFLVPSTPARFHPAENPIVFRPQAVTEFPFYLSAPILVGVALGIYFTLFEVNALVAFLGRLVCGGCGGRPGQQTVHRVLALAAILCLIAGAACAATGVYRLRTVSRAAVFGRLATNWVSTYIAKHNGEWPRSWDALRECVRDDAAVSGRNETEWIDAARACVAIDFQADPRAVARQSVEEFDAIRPLDGYGVDHRQYWQVDVLCDFLYCMYVEPRVANSPQPHSPSPVGSATRGNRTE